MQRKVVSTVSFFLSFVLKIKNLHQKILKTANQSRSFQTSNKCSNFSQRNVSNIDVSRRPVRCIYRRCQNLRIVHINHQLGLSISVRVQLKCQLDISWSWQHLFCNRAKQKTSKQNSWIGPRHSGVKRLIDICHNTKYLH